METYLDLQNALRGTGITKTSEYKDYARKMNDEAGKTIFPVSPDLKFKKDRTWVSYADLLIHSMEGFVQTVTVQVPAKPEMISVECTVTDTVAGLKEEVVDNIIVGSDGSLGVKITEDDKDWTYEDLSNYVAGKFAKLSDYKDFARSENQAKKLHLGKKLPVSPDIYFKDRGVTWNGANDFLQIDSTEINPKANKNLLKGITEITNILNDTVPVEAKEKSIVVPKYEIEESVNDNKLTNNIANAIMRLSDHSFKEIPLTSLNVKVKDMSSAYVNLEKILVCQTPRKNYTNVTYYDKISGTTKHTKANLLINKQEKELSVLLYNPENPDEEFSDKEIKDIISKIVTTKTILDTDKKPLSIYRTLAILEKQKMTISLFFMESNYQCFFDRNLELKVD